MALSTLHTSAFIRLKVLQARMFGASKSDRDLLQQFRAWAPVLVEAIPLVIMASVLLAVVLARKRADKPFAQSSLHATSTTHHLRSRPHGGDGHWECSHVRLYFGFSPHYESKLA